MSGVKAALNPTTEADDGGDGILPSLAVFAVSGVAVNLAIMLGRQVLQAAAARGGRDSRFNASPFFFFSMAEAN